MALTLVSTLGAEDANSYVDVAYCDTYWSGHYQTTKADAWAALQTSQKASALIAACRLLESVRFTYTYNPTRSSSYEYNRSTGRVIEYTDRSQPYKGSYSQALQFPRTIDLDTDTGAPFIPDAIKEAQCEQAVYLLTFDEGAITTRLQGIESDSVTVGAISLKQTFSKGSSAGSASASAFAPMALDRIKPFILSTKRIRRG
jgi:hypothetical protein